MSRIVIEDEDGLLSMLQDSVKGFAERVPGPASVRRLRAAGGDLDLAIWRGMAEAGWTALTLPEAMGGSGLGTREQAILSEALGHALIPQPLAHLAVLAGGLIGAGEGPEAHRLAAGLAAGDVIAAPAWQGADGKAAPVAAQGRSLSGAVHFVNAPKSASDFLVLARDAEGLLLASIPRTAAGLIITPRATVDGSLLGHLHLDGVQVTEEGVIARGAAVEAALAKAVGAARLTLAAELVGVAGRALEIAVEYTSGRTQFGKQIASFQVIQHRLVDMWGETEFAAAAVVNAVEAANPHSAALAVLAAKARAGDAALSVTRKAIHLHGAMGFTDECDIGLYMKRATVLNASLGQPEQLRLDFLALDRAA